MIGVTAERGLNDDDNASLPRIGRRGGKGRDFERADTCGEGRKKEGRKGFSSVSTAAAAAAVAR